MSTLNLFYSLTGNSRRVAHMLACDLQATPAEITCRTYASGFGRLRQALDLLTGASPSIEVPDVTARQWDLVVLGGPVWGGRPATPLRSYLKRYAARHGRVALFLTAGGTSASYPPEQAIAELTALAAGPPVAAQIFTAAQMASPDLDARVARFAGCLGAVE